MTHLSVRDVSVEYRTGLYPVRALDHCSLEVEDGQIAALVGPSGCGKTTLLSCLAGIMTPTSGHIELDGVDLPALSEDSLRRHRRHRAGIVFQAFNLLPSLSALDNVAAPLLTAGTPTKRARHRAQKLLERVDLEEFGHKHPSQLSGGQQQRVAIARALAHDPPLIVADEPTANLDYVQAEGVVELLRSLRGPGRVIVISTHDDRIVPVADRVLELTPGFRQDGQPPHEVTLKRGEILFRQGDRGELVYVVEHGGVEILREHTDGTFERLAIVRSGNYFGELSPSLGFPRSATTRALHATSLTAYSLRDFRAQVLGRTRGNGEPSGQEPSEGQ